MRLNPISYLNDLLDFHFRSNKVIDSPEKSYLAGKFWSFKHFAKHAEALAESVSKDNSLVGKTFSDAKETDKWSTDKLLYGNVALVLAKVLTPTECWRLGASLDSDEVFDKVSDTITDTLLEQDITPWITGESPYAIPDIILRKQPTGWFEDRPINSPTVDSILYWKPDRRNIIQKEVIAKYNLPTDVFDFCNSLDPISKSSSIYDLGDHPKRVLFQDLVSLASLNKVNALGRDGFELVSKASKYAAKHDDDTIFLTGFKQVAKAGGILPWAQAIIDHYEKDVKGAVGGDKYREVIAA
jgi:hypothetical protein